jgi:hypothetical protein
MPLVHFVNKFMAYFDKGICLFCLRKKTKKSIIAQANKTKSPTGKPQGF